MQNPCLFLKKNILKIIRPAKRSIFKIHNPNGIKWIFQLRVGLSPLKSHKNCHKFLDTPNDECKCRNAETTQHFLLKCPLYIVHRLNFFQTINPILLANDLLNLNDREMVRLLLYGHENLPFHANQIILKATIKFIEMTARFSQTPEVNTR